MNTRHQGFRGELLLVSILHGLLIGSIFVVALFRGCTDSTPTNLPMELMVELPSDDGPDREAPPQPLMNDPAPPTHDVKEKQPAPDKDDISLPDKDVVIKKIPPKKKDIKKVETGPKKIEVSKTLVRRNNTSGPRKSKLTAAEVQRLLDRGAKPGKSTLSDAALRQLLNSDTRFGDGNAVTQEAVYLDVIKQTMYRAWDQPTSLGIAGLVARVEFTFSSEGSISGCRMTAPSGNATMDESVMRAARSVHRINGVPATFFSSHRRITVAFELTGGT